MSLETGTLLVTHPPCSVRVVPHEGKFTSSLFTALTTANEDSLMECSPPLSQPISPTHANQVCLQNKWKRQENAKKLVSPFFLRKKVYFSTNTFT